MPDSTTSDADHADIQRRLAHLHGVHEAERGNAVRLHKTSRAVTEQYAALHVDPARARFDSRRAALNLLEDAEEARAAQRSAAVERLRADAALRISEEKYRLLFEQMNEAYCVLEILFDEAGAPTDFRYVDTNPAFARHAGQEMKGRRVREIVPDFEQFWLDRYGRVATTGESTVIEGVVAGLGDQWFRTSAFRLGGEESRLVGVIFSNITERKRAEETVRRSEELLRALIDNLPGGAAFIVDHDLRYLLAGGEALQTAGFEPGDLIGKTLTEALGAAQAAAYLPDYQAALRGEPFTREHEAHGRSFFSRGVPLRGTDGQIYGALALSYDVTVRKQTEAALRVNEGHLEAAREELRLLVENALEHAIISLDLDRRVRTWNPGAERMFGYPAAETVGASVDRIFTAEDLAAGLPEAEVAQALAEGRAGGERWHPRRDGSLFWGSCAMLPIRSRPGGEPTGFVKIMRDETPALEARQALEQSQVFLQDALHDTEAARAEAETASKSKDHFLAVLSHELRTPLTPVLMGVHMLNRQRGLTGLARETLEMIGRNVQLEVSLIDDLLDLTRVGRGKLELARAGVRPARDDAPGGGGRAAGDRRQGRSG